eukprot:1653086-Prorocentrum_lima.AAC.1
MRRSLGHFGMIQRGLLWKLRRQVLYINTTGKPKGGTSDTSGNTSGSTSSSRTAPPQEQAEQNT